ncbi:hypothetical protein OIU77_017110 [Salix suchowensis]|uniref:Uncharacterized protein n=1 Tax=Salix suchowensis TaxID=1278906 RepID=A0ABQ8ZMU9_9ROSI|nr:hypothetical protein OIU77_017110 [Salix suchowensis]KAJ6315772.1 hypothetical protein OIU78_019110 [Salix suchowensis]
MEKTSLTTPGTGSSSYLKALTVEIEKKLQRALATVSQRRNLLQELFADIALEVDDRARGIIFSREEGEISPAEDAADGQLCFYDVLADYYVRVPGSGKQILHLIVQLWSQSFASHIFSLLFHKWVCNLGRVPVMFVFFPVHKESHMVGTFNATSLLRT